MKKPKTKVINGNGLANEILHNLHGQIVGQKLTPSLAVILVGKNPASKTYIKLKQNACQKCGIEFFLYQLPRDAPEEQVIECVNFLNNDQEMNGIIVQLPLPKHLDEDKIIRTINPKKDADGFHPKNIELLMEGKPYITPGLCEGIIKLIQETKEDLTHKKILIISNSKIFSRPLSYLVSKEQCKSDKKCSCTWSSPKDKGLKNKTSQADVIIIAIGRPKFLKPEMIKKDCIIIDVGYNQFKGKTMGDVDSSCSDKAKWLSPVPGGVGPLTVALLLSNVVKICKRQNQIYKMKE